jgi:hypothetical protein
VGVGRIFFARKSVIKKSLEIYAKVMIEGNVADAT